MKKLLLLISLSTMAFAHDFTRKDLEKAIRAVDVSLVEQIVENMVLTFQEQRAFIMLAEEVVRRNEMRIFKPLHVSNGPSEYIEVIDFVPYDGPPEGKEVAEFFLSVMGIGGGVALFAESGDKALSYASFAIGVVFFFKFLFDTVKVADALEKQKELQRQRYEDAITIKHLIYMAKVQN
jgi:hypothetical protein